MRILGIERDETACNHYRILQPLYKLREHGMADILTIQERDFANIEFAAQKIAEADIVVFQRPERVEWLQFIKVCQEQGKILVCDYDDNPFETSPFSPAYRYWGVEEVAYVWPDGVRQMLWSEDMVGSGGEQDFFNIARNIEHRDMFRAAFKKADLVTTTTETLQNTLKTINPNVKILPNLIDFSLYPKCEMLKKEIRIGWQGGSSHYEDLYILIEPLKKILKKYKNVKFVYCGDMRFQGMFKDFPEGQIEFHHWVKHVVYPYKLVTWNLYIGLCPLADNKFNRNKSALKFFDYSVVKAATIATDIPPYTPVMKNTIEPGLLVSNDSKQWVEAIEDLIKYPQRRKMFAHRAYNLVYEKHNADKKAHLWAEAYKEVLEKPLCAA